MDLELTIADEQCGLLVISDGQDNPVARLPRSRPQTTRACASPSWPDCGLPAGVSEMRQRAILQYATNVLPNCVVLIGIGTASCSATKTRPSRASMPIVAAQPGRQRAWTCRGRCRIALRPSRAPRPTSAIQIKRDPATVSPRCTTRDTPHRPRRAAGASRPRRAHRVARRSSPRSKRARQAPRVRQCDWIATRCLRAWRAAEELTVADDATTSTPLQAAGSRAGGPRVRSACSGSARRPRADMERAAALLTRGKGTQGLWMPRWHGKPRAQRVALNKPVQPAAQTDLFVDSITVDRPRVPPMEKEQQVRQVPDLPAERRVRGLLDAVVINASTTGR